MSELTEREVAIFNDARRLAGSERAAYLDQACAGDDALRQRLDELLRVEEAAGDFLEKPAYGEAGAAAIPEGTIRLSASLSEKPGDRIGGYKLLEQIGEGGFGVVYMAEQEEPVHRRVALKVIKLGMDTRSVIARFEAERQALALMQHANIAKVFDAGATETGRPYFVMELVRGIKITDFCDQNDLSTRERLVLFIQVCGAIQHAHQKGIIHRDIKPSNILVTVNDGVAVPMVIDFGIAKATQGRLTDQTLFTAFEQFLGTPAYMSPEQAVMTNLDIDTRSDIYSLGVLLYELLTGKTPFDGKELLAAGLDQMRRTIGEKDPPRPSTRLSSMQAAEVATAAKRRQTDAPKLMHALRGDLDWIVMKALDKDRSRRYETANGLAKDIQRHLNDEPVTARPPSKLYLFQKVVRRNKLAFFAAGAGASALLLGTAVSTWSFVQEREARQKEGEQRRKAVISEANARNETEKAKTALALAKKTLDASDLSQAAHLSLEGHPAEALPYLVRILSTNPTNDAALTRLTTLLTFHSWMVPLVTVQHSQMVSAARFSPDGQRMVTASWDHTARVWSAQTGQTLTLPLQHDEEVWSAQFSPNGEWIVTASGDRTARVWDAQSGRPLTGPLRHRAPVWWAEFSPDSKSVVTASGDNTAQVWDAQTGLARAKPLQHSMSVISARFSPYGKRVVTASDDGTAQVWDAETGERIGGPLQHRGRVNSAQFSPDGERIVTASYDGTARVWDARTGRPLTEPLQHSDRLKSASFSPDGRWIVSASWDKTARIWDSWTGQALSVPLRHESTVTTAEFSPDGERVLTSCEDGGARVWDALSGRPLTEPSTQGGGLWSAQFSADGKRVVTASRDNTAVVWNVPLGRLLNQPFRHRHWLRSARFSPDARQIVTASNDKTARVWDALKGTPLTDPLQHDDVVESVDFSPDGGRVVTASADHTVCLWDAQSGRKLFTLRHDAGVVASDRIAGGERTPRPVGATAQFSPDGKWLLTTSDDHTARVWDANSGLPRYGPLRHGSGVYSAQFSSDGQRIVTASVDKTARVWDAASGQQLAQCSGHSEPVSWAEFSPDGKWIVTASFDHTARVWDGQTGQPHAQPMTHSDGVLSAQFSPDGKWLLTASWDHTARVWDAQSGLPRTQRLKHQEVVSWARFSPDGKRIVTASDDRTARVWDAESGLPLSEPLEHAGQVWTAEFSPDGKRILTASDDGTARIWDLAPSHTKCPPWLLQLAEAVSGQVVDLRGALEALTADRAEMVRQVQERLNHEAADDDWAIWGRWFLAAPMTRTISPFSKIEFREYLAHRLAENTTEGLEEVRRWAGLDTAESICRETLAESRKVSPNEPARWQSSLSSLVAVLARERKFEQAARIFNDALKPPGPPNLLINGSFEFGSFVTTTVTPGACNVDSMILAPGAFDITGWTVTGSPGLDFEWIGPTNLCGVSAADGAYFLDLTGIHDSVPYDGISQTIRTLVGQSYSLSFALGSDVRWDGSTLPCVTVEITGNPPQRFTVDAVGTDRWQVFNSIFTAASTNTTLTFTGANTNNIRYIGLDNVVVSAIPNSGSQITKPNSL